MWAGSPRVFSTSTAVSVTSRAASAAEKPRASIRSGAEKSPGPRIISGSPGPPGIGASCCPARVRGTGIAAPGGVSSTTPPLSESASESRAATSR